MRRKGVDQRELLLIRPAVGIRPAAQRVQRGQIGLQKLLVFPDALLLHITLLENRVGQQPVLVPRVCPVAVPPDQGEAGHQQGEDHAGGTDPDQNCLQKFVVFLHMLSPRG